MGVKGLTVTNKNQDFPSSYNHTTQLNDFTMIVYFMPVSWWHQGKQTMIHELGRLNSGITGAQAGWVGWGIESKTSLLHRGLKKNKKLLNIHWFVPALILCGRYLLVSFCGEERLLKVILLLQKVSKILSKMEQIPHKSFPETQTSY